MFDELKYSNQALDFTVPQKIRFISSVACETVSYNFIAYDDCMSLAYHMARKK